MNADPLHSLAQEAFRVLAITGGPVFGILLAVGLTIGVLQSATQINDSAVGFVPKLGAAILAVSLLGPWLVSRLAQFVAMAFQYVAIGRG